MAFLTQTPGTAPGFANVLNFYKGLTGPQDRLGSQWIGLSRIDWNASPRNQVSTTLNILRWDSPNIHLRSGGGFVGRFTR